MTDWQKEQINYCVLRKNAGWIKEGCREEYPADEFMINIVFVDDFGF